MNQLVAALLGICFLLTGFRGESHKESAYSRYPETEVPLSKVDFASYQKELSQEDWQALSSFFPILLEGQPFLAAHLPEIGAGPASLEELEINALFDSYGFEDPPVEFTLSSFSLCDITGDGQKELAMYSDFHAGLHLVLHKEGEIFYGVYMPIRWFEGLQYNGVFWGSGGAATSNYKRLHFADGTCWVELLGNTDWGYFAIAGREVSEDEFQLWLKDLLVGEATWHAAREK